MSIDENTNETELSNPSEEVTQVEEAAKSEAISAPAESASSIASNLLTSVLALKESNPKVFYGGVGAVVLLLLILVMSGGSNSKLPAHQSKAVVIGQNYVLRSANSYDPHATIRLVSVPGSMAAYDDTEEADREGCKHILEGTPVKVVQAQDFSGKKDAFVEVEMLEGECVGKKGWTLAINLQ